MKKLMAHALLFVILAMLLAGCSGGDKDLRRGSWTNNTYTNDYAELTFNKPESWVVATDEEIAELMNVSADYMSEAGLKFNEKLLKLSTIYDTVVNNRDTGTNVIIMYENLAKSIGGTKLTETEYLSLMREQLEEAQMGYVFGAEGDRDIGGNIYRSLTAQASIYGVGFSQYYYIRKIDKYMLAIIVTLYGDDSVDSVMRCFE